MTDAEWRKKAEELLRRACRPLAKADGALWSEVRSFLATPREPKRTEDRMTMSIRIMDAEWCLTCRAPMLQLSREERPDVYDGPCRCEPLAPAEPQEERYADGQLLEAREAAASDYAYWSDMDGRAAFRAGWDAALKKTAHPRAETEGKE